MKQFVLKQADLDHLMHLVKYRHISMLEKGTAEQYSEIVKDWISEVEI
jgi:hypothetical protein